MFEHLLRLNTAKSKPVVESPLEWASDVNEFRNFWAFFFPSVRWCIVKAAGFGLWSCEVVTISYLWLCDACDRWKMPCQTLDQLAHPEMLTSEEIVEILRSRNVPISPEVAVDKNALVDLCYKHIVPRPQRQPRRRKGGDGVATKVRNSIISRACHTKPFVSAVQTLAAPTSSTSTLTARKRWVPTVALQKQENPAQRTRESWMNLIVKLHMNTESERKSRGHLSMLLGIVYARLVHCSHIRGAPAHTNCRYTAPST